MYREYAPPAGLTGAVACVWRDEPTVPRRQRVLPDGCIDLMWLDDAVHVAGPDTTAFLAELRAGQRLGGLRFRPGAAPAVLGVPAVELRDQRVPLAQLWPGAARGLADRLAAGDDPADVLGGAVAGWAGGTGPDPALGVVLARLRDGDGVAGTADAVGWTERTLHRRCLAAFGYGPSVLRRILRFRRALRLTSRGMAFAEAATRAGYADQAQLAREVRELAGVPLGQLVGAKRSTPLPSGSSTTA